MRNYEGMKLPPTLDRHIRNELLKADKYLKQLSVALSRSLASGNYPTVIVRTGPGGVGNLPDHSHARTGEGGSTLGDPFSTINVYGIMEIDGAGLYIKDPAGASRVIVAAPVLAADVTHTLAAHNVTWPTALPASKLAMKMSNVGVITYESVDEVESLGAYGDGVDGAANFNGGAVTGASLAGSVYTLTRDVFYSSMTIANTYTVDAGGWSIFVNGVLTVAAGGILSCDGLAGSAGANGAGSGTPAGGAAGAQTLGQTMGSNGAGGAGRNGQVGVGVTGAAVTVAIGEGGNGGAGGAGEVGPFGAAGGVSRAAGVTNIRRQRSTLSRVFMADYNTLFTLIQGGTGGSGGASGGGDSVSARGAAGGGGGAGGRVMGIWAKTISNAGIIRANGGAGGAGGASAGFGGAGGGGGGGGGGFLWLFYDTLTNTGTIEAAGGAGGAAGTSGGYGAATAGADGATGSLVKYCRLTGVFS